MRNRIWHSMIAAKSKAIYLSYFNAFVRNGDRFLEGVIIITSSGGVGGWLIWDQVPFAWACLIGAAQAVKLLKPLLPFIKDANELAHTYYFYEELHLEYDKLWESMEAEENTDDEIKQKYFALRDNELNQQKKIKHLKVPRLKRFNRKTETDWNEYLRINYQYDTNE